MTNEQKQLLLIDLCARVPYGVMCDRLGLPKKLLSVTPHKVYPLELAHGEYMPNDYKVEDVKPYLRPMSSMTEEEEVELIKLFYKWHDDELFDYIEEGVEFSIWKHNGMSPVVFDWLNEHHFDYRGLIEKGLALEAPEGMYKTE